MIRMEAVEVRRCYLSVGNRQDVVKLGGGGGRMGRQQERSKDKVFLPSHANGLVWYLALHTELV